MKMNCLKNINYWGTYLDKIQLSFFIIPQPQFNKIHIKVIEDFIAENTDLRLSSTMFLKDMTDRNFEEPLISQYCLIKLVWVTKNLVKLLMGFRNTYESTIQLGIYFNQKFRKNYSEKS